jgi:hypothetical protein
MGCHWNLHLPLDLAAIWQNFATGLPVAIFCQINATQYKTHKFLHEIVQWLTTGKKMPVASHWHATCGIFATFWNLLALTEFVATCRNC